MILTALNQYYQRLSENPNPSTGLSRVPDYGFSEERISYILLLNREGQLVDIQPNFSEDAKQKGKYLAVPWSFKRSGKFTEKAFKEGKNNAFFLWDKSAYCLGIESSDKNNWKTSQLTFDAFKKLHLDLLAETVDEGLLAVRHFLENWLPEQFNSDKFKAEMVDANFAFRLDGQLQYIHQRPEAINIWLNKIAPKPDTPKKSCLVTGEYQPIMNLHPSIKGGYLSQHGGQSSGVSIVSFNEDAYTSYGKAQGENAPVSEAAAFAYTTALNYLLRLENKQCISIGDASTVFWAVADDEKVAHEAESLFNYMLNMPTDDRQGVAQIKPILDKIAQGRPLDEFAPNISASTRFFVLGLAPNASRLSIRYWLDSNFGELAQHIIEHFQDLSLDPVAWQKPPSMWQLLIQTVPHRKNPDGSKKKPKSEDIPPQLAGELMRSIITGQRYPNSLLAKLIQRIRSDGDMSSLRIAMIKAVLNRNYRFDQSKEAIAMGLNKEEKDIAYRLGRLFCLLEKAQNSALGDLSASIKDRFFAGASASPNSTFPMLLRNYQHHIAGLRKGKKAEWVKDPQRLAGWIEKEAGQIMEVFSPDKPFPSTLSLTAQGKFLIGYYHQRFTKQAEAPAEFNLNIEADLNTDSDTIGE
jgi:CRISPR-associated protein Csd1